MPEPLDPHAESVARLESIDTITRHLRRVAIVVTVLLIAAIAAASYLSDSGPQASDEGAIYRKYAGSDISVTDVHCEGLDEGGSWCTFQADGFRCGAGVAGYTVTEARCHRR